MDPRAYQIMALTGLLLYGVLRLDFEVGWVQIGVTLTSVLATQWAASRWFRCPQMEYRSALISGLSLCLLGRAGHWVWFVGLGSVAILSKFLLRWRGKHLFNPTNLALALGLLISDGRVWISPGQWGSLAVLAFGLVCLGGWVVVWAGRADVTLAFLLMWTALLFGRAWWLGDPLSIPGHRWTNGALLLFAFFMISDPKSTPDSRTGRILYAMLVAVGGWWWQYLEYHNHGLIWALAVGAAVVPVLDHWWPGGRYDWRRGPRVASEPPAADLVNATVMVATPLSEAR